MKQKVTDFISKHQLLTNASKVIVGVSGGADSVALLHYLHTNGYKCVGAHCNFHLRGEESNRDEKFVHEFCQKFQIPLEIINFDTEQIANAKKISIEMAARELRYNWFEQLRILHSADDICVAHHRDDSVETLLLNLIRGTGIRGLTGIVPRNGHIIRPFLCVNRNEIEEYITQHELPFVTDGTNAETIYLRNKIRLEILPKLEEINPSVRETIERTSDNLRSVEQIYLAEIEKQRAEVVTETENKTLISIDKLLSFSEPSTLLFELLQPYGFNRSVCEEVFASLRGISGKTFHSTEYILVKDRGELIIKKKEENSSVEYFITTNESAINQPINLTFQIVELADLSIDKNKNMAYFDFDKLEFPLKLRRWQQSDWFVPFGMNGKKKLSDYFTDHKYNLHQKEEAWLLFSSDDIIWIVGERSDNRFRISDQTKRVFKIVQQ
ncbi:MAG: tRNA lysidine(34) synthetase TilS [Bacteroidales bacterium]